MKKGYVENIEKITLQNTDYRRVLYTSKHTQLVVMNLKPGEEVGEEVHHLDQFIRIEQGKAKIIINATEYLAEDDYAIIIPEGCRHNVINIGNNDLKLYSLYSPPEHLIDTVHPTKADDEEDHWDGKTSE